MPAPEFQNISDGFMIMVFAKVGENLTENQLKIIQLLKSNKNISAQKIADEIGISQRKVEENIAKLKALGLLKRIGPAKGGHWQVIE